jgi:hypothetical protein
MLTIEETFTRNSWAERNAFDSTNKMFPKFSDEEVAKATKMEVWGTTFDHPGADFCEFRLINEKDEIILKTRVDGY